MPRKKTAKKPKAARKYATSRAPLTHCLPEILSTIIVPRILVLWEKGHRTNDALLAAYNAEHVAPRGFGPVSKDTFRAWVEAAGFRAPGRDLVPTLVAHTNAAQTVASNPNYSLTAPPSVPAGFNPDLLRDDGEPITGPLSPSSEPLNDNGGLSSPVRQLLTPPPDPLPENHPEHIIA